MLRAIWSGTIAFGLVTIPVRLLTAIRDKKVHFHLLSKDGTCRLRQRLYCPETGKEYDFKETARGYEIAPDQYVVIEEEELERVKPEPGRRIEITDFVDLASIDPIYYDHSYYLAPEDPGVKPYKLLVEAMKRTGRVAVAKFVMRDKEYLAAIRPVGDALLLQTMNYADAVVSQGELDLPLDVAVGEGEVGMAEKIIEALSGTFDPGAYHDAFREKIEQLVQVKAAGGDVSRLGPEPAAEEPRVINLMEALEVSLRRAEPKKRRKSA